MPQVRVAIYERVSTTDQSVASQESQLVEFASKRGWHIQDVYCDEGISGKRRSRPGLDRLVSNCRKGRIDVVLCQRLDRLGRNLIDLLRILEELRELRIDFV